MAAQRKTCPWATWPLAIAAILLAAAGAAADDWHRPTVPADWAQPMPASRYWRLPPVEPFPALETPALTPPASVRAVSYESVDEASSEPTVFIGYDDGFVLANHGCQSVSADEYAFLMRVNGWCQLRHTLFDSDGPNPDQNTFSFERLRLSFGGHAFTPDLHYFLQLDGNSDRSTNAIFLDYFASYDLGHDLFCWEKKRFGLKGGKWKVPFSRSREESGRLLQFTDRASANVFFDLNRSIGVGMWGRLDPLRVPVHFETAVFNGFKTGSVSTDRSNGLDRNFGWSLRSYADFGEIGAAESDYNWHEQPAARLSGGIAYTQVDIDGTTEFERQQVVDSGATLSSILPAGVTEYDVWLFTVDAHFKYHGFSFIADYYWRYLTQFDGAPVGSLFDQGFVLQTGYFVVPQKLELLFRWSRIFGDSGTLGVEEESSDEVAAGIAWFINAEHAKLVFDATHLNGVPVSSSRLDMLPGDAGWLFRTQFQLAF